MTTSYTNTLAPSTNPKTIVVVRKDSAFGSFSNIQAALDSIIDASATKPYIVKVSPGVYVNGLVIAMKPYVSIVGEDFHTCIIDFVAPVGSFTSANNSSLEGLTFRNSDSALDINSWNFDVTDCKFENNVRNASISDSNSAPVSVNFSNCVAGNSATGAINGFYISTIFNTDEVTANFSNLIVDCSTLSPSSLIKAQGPLARVNINGIKAIGDGTGELLTIYNETKVSGNGIQASNFLYGIHELNFGTVSDINITGLYLTNCTNHVKVESATTTGAITGIFTAPSLANSGLVKFLTQTPDHGTLAGLGDDDHTQYHNDTRGDVRYYTKTLLEAGQLDNRYFTETEVTASLAGKANTSHTQTASTIPDFSSAALAVVLTGLSLLTGTAVVSTDSILVAFGKLQKQVTDNLATLTAHIGSGGTAHSNATISVAGFMSGTDKTKLDGVATGATANSSDAVLLARANHTGTQLAATISDFNAAADARVVAGITGKENTITAGTSAQYWRGDKSFQTLNTAAVPELTNLYYTQARFDTAFAAKTTANLAELTNLYFTNARGIGATLTSYVSAAGTVSASDSILQAIQKLNGNIAGKEPTIATGNSTQYITGAKALATLDTLAVPENTNLYYTTARFDSAFAAKTTANLAELTNLYFTNSRAIAAPLTGYVSTTGTISSADSILTGINKLDGNVALKEPGLGNPSVNGYILSSTTAGVRSWIVPPSGGGGGSTINKVTQEVNFGTASDYVLVTVAAAWVTSASYITLSITPNLIDHDIEDILIEELTCTYGNIVDGVSFDIHVHAPNETHGRYIIKAIGA